MTMRTALRTSSNRAAVRMLQQVGIAETVQGAERLGVGSMPSVPSLALGSGEVTLMSMTAAYAAFANKGMLTAPTLIRRVETTSGEVLFDGAQLPQRAVSESTAFLMTSMMADVVNSGTGWQARRVGFTLPAAGKTGTTNDYHDAWFVGYTPKLVAGVWVGYDQPQTIISNGYAGDLAVPIWGRFMKAATEGDGSVGFRPPSTVTTVNVCRLTGKLPVDGCRTAVRMADDGTLSIRSTVYTEYFVRGTEPVDFCPVHGSGGFGGLIAGVGGDVISPPPAVPVATTGPASASRLPEPMPPPPGEPEVKKKRGFWSRVFGVGKDEKKKDPKP
jgi:penicillin-binding protein 1A